MRGPTDGPGFSATSDGSGALTLDAVPHPAGPVLVHARGEIDTVTAPFLSEQLRGWFAAAPRVVLDLSRVSFLGSAGLSALLAGTAEADAAGVLFQLACGEARQVRRVLQITGTLEHLDVVDRIPPGAADGPGGRSGRLFAVPDPGPADGDPAR